MVRHTIFWRCHAAGMHDAARHVSFLLFGGRSNWASHRRVTHTVPSSVYRACHGILGTGRGTTHHEPETCYLEQLNASEKAADTLLLPKLSEIAFPGCQFPCI